MEKEPVYILLADDDEDDRLIFKEAFKELMINIQVKTVNDGLELMNYLSKPGTNLPHILFLDLNMPRKTGIECLTEIKTIDYLNKIPIAIYSTSSSEDDISETYVKGANIYIKKPNNFLSLKKVLEKVIATNWQYQTSGLNKGNYYISL